MTHYSKYNFVYRMQKWMDSVPGQTFLNYAYSWGAAIVILGTLFKLTHLPGANFMLFLGMGTEVVVFFLSAFDRPFDKTADGRELPTRVDIDGENAEDEAEESAKSSEKTEPKVVVVNAGGAGNAASATPRVAAMASDDIAKAAASQAERGENSAQSQSEVIATAPSWVAQQQEVTPDMAEAQSNYVDELKRLTETLGKVSEQSVRLTRDSEEMENLNRTLTGICKVYEMQLKSASQQIGTIDQINEQSRKMAEHIEQLNKIYKRMIEAMTVNMPGATLGNTNQNGL